MKIKIIASIFLLFILNSCYLMKQGYYFLKMNSRAEKIDDLLKNSNLDSKTKEKLKLVLKIKKFAVQELSLKENKNYTVYIALNQDYLTNVVSASAKDSFRTYTWWFPFMGSFPYKGFYVREDAIKEAKELKKAGLDVLVRKVDAFSSLGYFTDPIYSYMLKYSTFRLASLLIHEQTHATVYLKNQGQFNENLAIFVEREGSLLFLEKFYGKDSKEYINAKNSIHDYNVFIKWMHQLAAKLNQLYQKKISKEEKLKQRADILKNHQKELAENYDKFFKSPNYKFLLKIPVNNAYIGLFLLYEGKQHIFYELYKKMNYDLVKTIKKIKTLNKIQPTDAFSYISKNWLK